MFFFGLAVLAFAEVQHNDLESRRNQGHRASGLEAVAIPLLQHLASALIVASVMGVSYEYFVHKHVIESFRYILNQNQEATEQAFDAFRTLTAREVFDFIGNVASHNAKIPTLFRPPRDAVNEILFSTDTKFFQRLIGSANALSEAAEVLGKWLEAPDAQRRFLASDFIGFLRLTELEPKLRELAAEQEKEWRTLSEIDKCCVLNYRWAISRLETPMYGTLQTYLIESSDPFIQKWILSVPRQMPDAQLARIVTVFLKRSGDKVSHEILAEAITAIEALHHAGFDMRQAVRRSQSVFENASLWQVACAAVSVAPPHTKPKQRKTERLKFLKKGAN